MDSFLRQSNAASDEAEFPVDCDLDAATKLRLGHLQGDQKNTRRILVIAGSDSSGGACVFQVTFKSLQMD